MTAETAALIERAKKARTAVYLATDAAGADDFSGIIDGLLKLIPEPPTDDEREAVMLVLADGENYDHSPDADAWMFNEERATDRLMASPVWRNRGRGPITDEVRQAVADAIDDTAVITARDQFLGGSTIANVAEVADAALEAARDAEAPRSDFATRVDAAARLLCPQSTEERRDPCDQCVGRTNAMLRAADRT